MNYLLVGLLTTHMVAQTLMAEAPASAIIHRGEAQMRGRSTQAVMMMTVKRPDFTRVLKIRAWTVGNKQALVEILDPPKEEGTTSLRVTTQMWNYLPKADQVVRVPTSLMLQSWMGSDFTNDDLMKASSIERDYVHRLRGKHLVGDQKTVLIECRPKPGASVVWGKILYWARVSDSLPVQQKFYDEDGRLVRTVSFGKFRKMDDRLIPTVLSVHLADEPGKQTIVEYQKILYDRKISAGIFNQDRLRHISQQSKNLANNWFKQKLPGGAPTSSRTRRIAANEY